MILGSELFVDKCLIYYAVKSTKFDPLVIKSMLTHVYQKPNQTSDFEHPRH